MSLPPQPTPGSERVTPESGSPSPASTHGLRPGWWSRFGDTALGVVVKLLLLAGVAAIGLWMLVRLIAMDAPWWASVLTAAATLGIIALYTLRGRLPLKYLVPGVAFLLVFQVFPFVYTFYIAFTNFSVANNLTHPQVIERVVAESMQTPPDAPQFAVTPMTSNGEVALWMVRDEDGAEFLGTEDGIVPAAELDTEVVDGEVVQADSFERASLGQAQDRLEEFQELRIPLDGEEAGEVRLVTLSRATVSEPNRLYDPDRDAIVQIDLETGEVEQVFAADHDQGRFVDPETGATVGPGWRTWVGTDNWVRAFTNEAIRDPFFGVLIWTYIFAAASTFLTFVVGLALAMTFNDERLRGRKFWRAAMIIPYALPTFLTALIWRGMMNRRFGVINEILGVQIPWLVDPTVARFSVVLVNLWLGFPYMFLITLGALQSIPSDVYEAAKVDGAGPWARMRRITLPLLLVTVSPVLLATFAFNFNNFNVIFLVTGGNPPIAGAATPVGHTDILISYTYRIAFGAGGGDYGLGAVVAMITFLMVAVISVIAFKYIRPLEEVHR